MRFLRRNKFVLLFLAVLVFASVMVVRQFVANQSAHVELREDFILLIERQESKAAESVYQRLVQQLPNLADTELANDLVRATLLRGTNVESEQSLLFTYEISVKDELRKRAEKRISRAKARAEIP